MVERLAAISFCTVRLPQSFDIDFVVILESWICLATILGHLQIWHVDSKSNKALKVLYKPCLELGYVLLSPLPLSTQTKKKRKEIKELH